MNIFSGNIKESDEHFSFINEGEDKNNFIFIWTLGSHKHMPYSHIHLFQKETFEVLKGILTIKLKNKIILLKTGDIITIPKRTWHIPYNNLNEEVICKVTLSPTLHAPNVIKKLCSLSQQNKLKNDGRVKLNDKLWFLFHSPENFTLK